MAEAEWILGEPVSRDNTGAEWVLGEPVPGQEAVAAPAGDAGIMTLNTGYWGATYNG